MFSNAKSSMWKYIANTRFTVTRIIQLRYFVLICTGMLIIVPHLMSVIPYFSVDDTRFGRVWVRMVRSSSGSRNWRLIFWISRWSFWTKKCHIFHVWLHDIISWRCSHLSKMVVFHGFKGIRRILCKWVFWYLKKNILWTNKNIDIWRYSSTLSSPNI